VRLGSRVFPGIVEARYPSPAEGQGDVWQRLPEPDAQEALRGLVEAWLRRRRDGQGVPLQCGAHPQSGAGKEAVMIKAIGHVALQVPNLDQSVGWATTVMGLREVAREGAGRARVSLAGGSTSFLTHGGAHHSLIYIEAGDAALDHSSLPARDEDAMHELNDQLAKHGVRTIDHQREPGVKDSIRFAGPDGHVFEVFTGMSQDQ